MSHLLFTGFSRIACRLVFFVWCLLFLFGCITAAKLGQSSADKSKITSDRIQLKSIDLKVNPEDTIDVEIKGNGKMQYSAVKQDFPLGVLVYLHDAVIADKFKQPPIPENLEITSVSASYVDGTNETIAVKILLNKNLNYQVQEQNEKLIIVFYKKNNNQISDTIVENDLFQEVGQTSTTELSSSGQAASNNQPVLPNNKNHQDNNYNITNYDKNAVVTGIDFHSSNDGESSIVIKTSNPIKYDMQRNDAANELNLNLYNTKIPEYHQRQLITTYFNSAVDKIIPIDRSGKESVSNIRIVLREKVPYHILQEKNNLTLFLEPSSIKPIKFEDNAPQVVSGTTTIVSQTPLPDIDDTTSITDSQKIESDENKITSNSSAQTIAKSSKNNKDIQEADDEAEPEDLEADQNNADVLDEEDNKNDFFDDNPVYTGEEISLDFYETDIKNVFKILQTVSGENFAVDNDVEGTVTLTLEKPAPWDEILDLILKMNKLGKIQEGSIVRIARMDTIKKEEEEKAALFKARIEAMEQKKQQEPMFTEYIPINYANAETDIKPHVEKLLTPKRENSTTSVNDSGGKVSVDKRTNMLILTDTKNKITQIKQLIYTLDKVTPQILISARIVEVTKNFSRELGVNWGITDSDTGSPSIYRDDIGGLYGYDVAVNPSVLSTTSSTIGYTFSRIGGTPLLLDARLTASEETGDTKVISSPKILTLDNKEATISQGFEVPYPSSVDNNGNVTYEFKKIDLALTVKPQVTPDKRISMTLKITKNELAGWTDTGIPFANTNEANTELLVNDGNTIVIGGIVKSTISEDMKGVPLLSNIPYLGKLFRQDKNKDKRDELLLFITPSIIQLDQIRQ